MNTELQKLLDIATEIEMEFYPTSKYEIIDSIFLINFSFLSNDDIKSYLNFKKTLPVRYETNADRIECKNMLKNEISRELKRRGF